MRPTQVLGCLVLALAMTQITAYKILFIPIPIGSHMTLISSAAEAFVAAGHEVHIIKPRTVPVPSQYKNAGFHFINHGKEGEVHLSQTDYFTKTISTMHELSLIDGMKFLYGAMHHFCYEVLTNEELYRELAKTKWDFVLTDEMPTMTCYQAVPHRLGIPYGVISVGEHMDLLGLTLQHHYLRASIPFLYTKDAGFLLRLKQFFMMQTMRIGKKLADVSFIMDYTKDRPLKDISELSVNAKIWLIDNEPMIYGPKHAPPNLIYVGGFSAGKPKPLPADLQKYADSATEGLIVVSFGGSLTAEFPERILKNLLMGLSSVKYKVVIRLKTPPTFEIGKNILLTKWLPQNDLLAHKNTVLFITHCGVSSINEAVHHGVPMIGFPNQDEQRGNARRFADKNYGLIMERKTFTADELKTTIEKMMTDPTWKNAVKKASSIIKGRRASSGEEAVYWVEHVIKYGADHLTPNTIHLAWYQILMLDIMAAILLIAFVFIFILVKCCKFAKRICCGKTAKSKKQKKS